MEPRRFTSFMRAVAKDQASPAKPPGFNAKDIVTIGFSTLSLVLSLITAYVQYLRFDPGLSVGWAHGDIWKRSVDLEPVGYLVKTEMSIVLINTGNVPLLIQDIQIGGRDSPGELCETGFFGRDRYYLGSVTVDPTAPIKSIPFVSKPGEIMIVPMQIRFSLFDTKMTADITKDLEERTPPDITKDHEYVYCISSKIIDTRGTTNVILFTNVQFRYWIKNGQMGSSVHAGSPTKFL